MQRRTIVISPRSISSTTGWAVKTVRIASRRTPARRGGQVLPWMRRARPAAQGRDGVRRRERDARLGRRAGSRRRRPGAPPRREHLFLGEGELARGDHAGEAVEDLQVDPLQLPRWRLDRRRRLPRQHRRPYGRSWSRTGIAVTRTRSPSARRRSTSPSMISPLAAAWATTGRCVASIVRPTTSSRKRVCPVVGRTWSSHQVPVAALVVPPAAARRATGRRRTGRRASAQPATSRFRWRDASASTGGTTMPTCSAVKSWSSSRSSMSGSVVVGLGVARHPVAGLLVGRGAQSRSPPRGRSRPPRSRDVVVEVRHRHHQVGDRRPAPPLLGLAAWRPPGSRGSSARSR